MVLTTRCRRRGIENIALDKVRFVSVRSKVINWRLFCSDSLRYDFFRGANQKLSLSSVSIDS